MDDQGMKRGRRAQTRFGRIFGLVAVAVLVIGVWFWLAHRTKETPAPTPLRVETMRVEPSAVPASIDTFGTIVSR